jgi:hypothetical protein
VVWSPCVREGAIEMPAAHPRRPTHEAALQRAGAANMRSIMSMRTTQEIVESIDKRLRELNDEIKTLDAARVALDRHENRPSRQPPAGVINRRNSAASASARTKNSAQSRRETSAEVSSESASRSRKRARTTSRARAKGTLKAIPADRVESLLSANGGLTTSTLVENTGGNRDHVLRLLRELEAAGRVRRAGQRRATRWHTITDEDRIRERAAELEATRKRPA